MQQEAKYIMGTIERLKFTHEGLILETTHFGVFLSFLKRMESVLFLFISNEYLNNYVL